MFLNLKKVDNDHSRLYTYIMTDNRKDVEYIVVTSGRGVAITPRLNK